MLYIKMSCLNNRSDSYQDMSIITGDPELHDLPENLNPPWPLFTTLQLQLLTEQSAQAESPTHSSQTEQLKASELRVNNLID